MDTSIIRKITAVDYHKMIDKEKKEVLENQLDYL